MVTFKATAFSTIQCLFPGNFQFITWKSFTLSSLYTAWCCEAGNILQIKSDEFPKAAEQSTYDLYLFLTCGLWVWPVLTFAHKFCYNVDGLLRHHSVERYQFVMSEFLHDLSLLQEGLWRHGAWLQGLNSHLSSAIPCAWVKTKTKWSLFERNHKSMLHLCSLKSIIEDVINVRHFQCIKCHWG